MKKEISLEEIKKKAEKDFLILLVEEYGYRIWFWFPNMNEERLLEWWKELESVDSYFMTPEPLEGWLVEMTEELDGLYSELQNSKKYITAHLHCNDDSYMKLVNGEIIYHKGYVKE